jgi:glycosyltransferase involved in cell wall biosynthesis
MDIDCNYFKNFLREPIFKKNRSKIKSLIKSIRNNIHNFFSDLFSLWGMYQANLVLSQSASQKESLHSKLGIESEIFYNIHPKPELQKVKIHRDVPTVLWLANIKSWKQPEIYLRLAKDLSAYKINFKMAGYIKDQKYKSLIEETELTNKRFEYLGGQTYESSNELIDIADIFVNTSKSQEGFPNTFIQSWLRGVPVISLNFDPDDIILKNQLGCISNSYEKLKSQVIDLAEDSDKRSKIAEKAIDFSNNHFISERKIDDFIRLVSEAKSKMN